jgi:8-oxo-dGTP pyrophosphatase MutT (NUDIX family)
MISEYLRSLRSRVGSSLLLVPSVTGLVFDPAGRVLLVRHSNGGVWVAPGGAVDPDETPQDAVAREMWEETGLHVEPVSTCGVFGGPAFRVRYANGDQVSYVMSVFECRRLGGELRVDHDEILEARYFADTELPAVELSPWARVLVPALVARRGRCWIPPVTWRPPGEETP